MRIKGRVYRKADEVTSSSNATHRPAFPQNVAQLMGVFKNFPENFKECAMYAPIMISGGFEDT
jgi:hypothetical protein